MFERWDEVKEMHRRWWARANERPYVWAAAPLPRDRDETPEAGFGAAPLGPAADLEEMVRRWTDPQVVIPRAERWLARTYRAGMAFPNYWPNLGPSIASAYLGCPLIFHDDTSWQEPIVDDWDRFFAGLDGLVSYDDGRVRFADPQGQRWWQATLDLVHAASERAPGRYIVGVTDIGGSFDLISHLRYPSRLCEDLIDSPDVLVTLRDWLTRLWFALYEEQMAIIRERQDGSCSWIGLWSPGTSYPLQCDFSCMVSPAMFEKYILPEIADYAHGLDNAIYHLDGPGAVQHVDALLGIQEIDAIQWVPGEGTPSAVHWIPMLQKMQRAGKGLLVYAETLDEVRVLAQSLRSEGLLIATWCSTPAEADTAVAAVG